MNHKKMIRTVIVTDHLFCFMLAGSSGKYSIYRFHGSFSIPAS